jgi:nondiscriminating aspartyl-tRNA synthetase
MERTLTGDLHARVGERVRLAGWLHLQRRLARLTFVLLRDRAGLAQVVAEEPEAIEAVEALLPETVLEVEATVAASDQAPGGVELREPRFVVLAEPAEAPPVELRRPALKESLPTQLDHAPVALRHPRRREAFQVAAASVRGFRSALDALGFVEIQTPKLVASATEGGSNVFRVDYFGATRTWRRARSSSSRRWSASSSASTRSARSSAPSLTRRRATWPSTSRSTRSSGSSATTST